MFFAITQFSQVTSNIIEALVSINRLSAFFAADELQVDAREVVRTSKERLEPGDEVLAIHGGEFTWNKEQVSPTLEDINLVVKKGELVGVLGRVGAGKVCDPIFFFAMFVLMFGRRRVCCLQLWER